MECARSTPSHCVRRRSVAVRRTRDRHRASRARRPRSYWRRGRTRTDLHFELDTVLGFDALTSLSQSPRSAGASGGFRGWEGGSFRRARHVERSSIYGRSPFSNRQLALITGSGVSIRLDDFEAVGWPHGARCGGQQVVRNRRPVRPACEAGAVPLLRCRAPPLPSRAPGDLLWVSPGIKRRLRSRFGQPPS